MTGRCRDDDRGVTGGADQFALGGTYSTACSAQRPEGVVISDRDSAYSCGIIKIKILPRQPQPVVEVTMNEEAEFDRYVAHLSEGPGACRSACGTQRLLHGFAGTAQTQER